jgi:RNA polymerase sigma-70 factor (ECF subfamily)
MDKAAFKLLFKEHYKAVFNYLYFSCSNYELSRDLTQDTFFKLWEQRSNIKDTKTLLPFLLKIAKNLLFDYYRHKKVEQKYAEHEISNEQLEETTESQTNAIILEEKIREIVRTQMNSKTQSIFIMSRFDGKSNDEIAEVFGISKKTIENQLYIATSILREKLKPFLLSVLIALNVFK